MTIRFRDDTNLAHGAFYVSAIREGRRGQQAALVAGPYADHETARRSVWLVRKLAEDIDPRSVWWAWGTCSLPEAPDGHKTPLGVVCDVEEAV